MPTNFVPLRGSIHQQLEDARPAGPVDTSEIASITIRTRPATSAQDLEKKVGEIYAQGLGQRSYLSREALADMQGANAGDLDAIEQYAQTHNLVVSHRSPAERSLVLTGKLADLLRAFPADLRLVHHSTGTFRSRHGEIMMPKEFEGIITGIFGYDTRPKHRAPAHMRAAGAGPGGNNGVSPAEFAKRYKFPTNFQGAKIDGSGQCIGIIELGGGFNNSDLQIYFQEIKVALPKVAAVSVDHVGNHPTKSGADDGEVMLDIEVAGAVAPKATIAVYFAPNTNKGFLDAINFAIHDTQRKPSVISISWGGPEVAADQQSLDAYHEVFLQAAAMGVTVCTASGDHGTADQEASQWDKKIHVDHPSVDPAVLACGGTQINSSGKDVVWNDGTKFNTHVLGGGGWASGGGISQTFGVPDYQKNAKLPVSIDTGKPGRGVPDIAMSATDYFTRVQGSEGASGGTSAVAPLMAGLVALLNQAKKKNVGFLNPFLYANSGNGIFVDVTEGTNAITSTVKGYTAGVGWDACTGLGTPVGDAILAKLA